MRWQACTSSAELLLRLLRRFGRAEEAKEEVERVRASYEAAGRPPLQAGQRAALSGQAGHVAATFWSRSAMTGLNPKPSEPASSDCQRVFITSKLQIGGELAKSP